MPARKWIHRKRNSQPSVLVSVIVTLPERPAVQELRLLLVLVVVQILVLVLVVLVV